MMEGITILAQEAIVETNTLVVVLWFSLPPIIGLILGLVTGYLTNEDAWIVGLILLGTIIGVASLPITLNSGNPTGEYTYKVIISESVSIAEFYERYEIIDQYGLIYEIRERGGS